METIQPRTRAAVLRIAGWQEGVIEMPSGSNKVKYNTAYYGKAVSGRAFAWCLVFVWWVFREAGFNLYKTASCTAFVNRYRAFSPGQIVTAVDGGSVLTVEGNTGTDNDANGGAVMQRTRRVGLVTCAIRPGYPD